MNKFRILCMSIPILFLINLSGAEIPGSEDLTIDKGDDDEIDLSVSSDHFIINQGQIPNSDILYYSSSGNAYFLTDGILFRYRDLEPIVDPITEGRRDPQNGFTSYRERGVVLRYGFEGSNPSIPEGMKRCDFDTNYFKGSDPEGWFTGIPNYEEITYPDLWNGIDLVLRISDGSIKYDLVVDPGADPGDIEFTLEGHQSLAVDRSGDLIIGTGYKDVRDSGLTVFQDDEEIFGFRFDIRDDNIYGFSVSDYDRSDELVIDPLLGYSTFIGGGGYDYGEALSVDENGSVYITGVTTDDITSYPTTTGAYDIVINGTKDVFVTKLSSDGSSLLYSTYIGGSDADKAMDIFVDTNGSAYITGYTAEGDQNYPATPDAFSTEYIGGIYDAFVTKLSRNGDSLEYSTLIGGSENDRSEGIAVDDAGNAFITGYTRDGSPDFPTTTGVYRETHSGITDVFVAKFSSDGSSLVYSTLLGGTNNDWGSDISIDDAGNAYVTGRTSSSASYPVTVGAYNISHSGNTDVFVTKLSSDGSSLVFSTFLGGAQFDGAWGICLDASGSVYVTGYTGSTDFPTTSGSFDESLNGWDDVFVTNDTQPNFLFRNQGDGTFNEEAMIAGVAFDESGRARGAMGADAADYDGSGRPSLAVGNFSNEMLALYHNEGSGLFIDSAPTSSIGHQSLLTLSFGTFFLDFDLDGHPDLFVANGHVEDEIQKVQERGSHAQPPHLFRNLGGGRFEDVAFAAGVRDLGYCKSVAWGDVNGDGYIDLVAGDYGAVNKVYVNSGGQLEPNPAWTSDDIEYTQAVAWGDVDNDGDPDL
ncbi:MAG: FG-GAP-like repeat-containing protein, partial [Thermoplasmatota archaeon]